MSLHAMSGSFQYLKGAIGRRSKTRRLIEKPRFQYLKGAIGSRRERRRRRGGSCFNTSKVRLGGARRLGPGSRGGVSIPQRCDWELRHPLPLHEAGQAFQYLKGAIGSRYWNRRGAPGPLFQYLKGAIGSANPKRSKPRLDGVSIPQRCDWEFRASLRASTFWGMFQYLKGAIGSIQRDVRGPRTGVSIPQRCDWEDRVPGARRRVNDLFQYLKGAIGRRRLPERFPREPQVSIPQRCDWERTGPWTGR